jgi:hypothetical protein
MPGRNGQSEKDFVLHQLGHQQLARHRQKIPGVVFQLVLGHLRTSRNEFQAAVDVHNERDRFEATLAGKRERPGDLERQHWFATIALVSLEPENQFPRYFRKQILQAFKAGYRQRSFENAGITGKRETVRNPFQT